MTTPHVAVRVPQRPPAPFLVCAAMLVMVVAVLPWSERDLAPIPGFLPAWLATLMGCDAITVVLLLSRARGGASPRLLVLAAGYLWSGLLLVGLTLAVPGLATARPLIADSDALWWLWVARHVVPPVCIAAALLPWPAAWRFGADAATGSAGGADAARAAADGDADPHGAVRSRLVARVVMPTLLLAAALLVAALLVPGAFPSVSRVSASVGGSQPLRGVTVVVVLIDLLAVAGAATGVLLRRSRSGLEAWAVVAAVAFLGDAVMTLRAELPGTIGFLVGRALGLVSGVAVLSFMLRDVFALHRRTADDAAQLQRQNQDLLDAGRLRDHLVAVVSHEMRTPLAGLQGYLELLSGEDDPDTATTARMLERSWLLTRRLTLLAEDLLAVAAVEHGEFVVIPETVHLAHQLDECAACFPDLDLRLACPSDLMVHADTLRLQQVLTNLVRNAQKHGAEPVFMTCTAAPPVPGRAADGGDGGVVIRVADSGPGVPRDFVHRLFDRYVQGANPRPGGSGIGLSVVRDLVRAHGGTVRYDLTDPAFVVTLPGAPGRAARLRVLDPVAAPPTATPASGHPAPASALAAFQESIPSALDPALDPSIRPLDTALPLTAVPGG